MEVFVLGRSEGFESQVVDDQQGDPGQDFKPAFKGSHGSGRLHAREQLRLGCEQDLMALTHGAMAEGLGEMAFPCSAGSGDEEIGGFLDKAAGSQFLDEAAVDAGVEVEVELLDGLLGAEAGTSEPEAEFFLISSGRLILDEQGQELWIGELGLDGLAVSCRQGFEDA